MLSRTVALPVIVGRGRAEGRAAAPQRGLPPRAARRAFAAGTATSFASTLASQALIRLVERDSAALALRRLPRRAWRGWCWASWRGESWPPGTRRRLPIDVRTAGPSASAGTAIGESAAHHQARAPARPARSCA